MTTYYASNPNIWVLHGLGNAATFAYVNEIYAIYV